MGLSPATFATWGPGTGETPFGGAAQFTAASGSTITLTSRLPNIFGTDGDEIKFDLYQSSASEWTVFGSTVSPDAITVNDDTITITDGTTSDSITLDGSLSTSDFVTIRLIRVSDEIVCRINGFLQANTMSVIPIDIDIIGKNQDAYSDVYAIQFRSAEHGYLSKSSPVTLQGDGGEWFGKIAFTLNEVGDHCLIDALSGNDGFRVEIINKYLSTHILRWTVGDGTQTHIVNSDEVDPTWVFYVGDTESFVLDIEDLGEETPGASDVTFEGDWSPNSGTVYVGSQAASSNFAGLKLHQLITGNTGLTSAQRTFLLTSAFDEITVSSEVTLSDCTNAYIFDETSGARADSIGSDDLTESPGELAGVSFGNGNFETLDAGAQVFEGWTAQAISGSGTTVNAESSDVYAGTYSCRFDMPAGGGQTRLIPDFELVAGKSYDFSIFAKIGSLTGSPSFRLADSGNNNAIGFNDFDFSSTDWTEYTDTVTSTQDIGVHLRPNNDCEDQSVYFDNFTLSPTDISRALGMHTSHLNAASFTGYLRNVSMVSGDFAVTLPLSTDANDTSGDENDGTAASVTFVTEDPAS